MQAYVYYDMEAENREQVIRDHAKRLHISPFDCVVVETEDASIGIAHIRTFIRTLSLAPQNGDYTAGILANAHLLTMEAQQALLKTLEEPPNHAYIFLGAEHDQQLISTIRSRCITMSRSKTRLGILPEEHATALTLINELLRGSHGEKIRIIQGVGKSKEDIDHWISIAINILREELLLNGQNPKESEQKLALIHRLLSAKKYLTNNVQPLLLIEHAILNISPNHTR